MKYIIPGLFLTLLSWMIADAWMRPGPGDLEGNFEELAFVRNEQNTGPVIRVYAVSVKDTLWNNMKMYGNYMPHNKYGNTKVYFFLKETPAPPQLFLEHENMENQFKDYCIGMYEKNAMSQTHLSRYPFVK